ncbi:MAG TPA: DUF29 family protein [Candidatus Tectomicrobia bacterium]|nr:DUF29 family protein [Candidatus Tectomicrobia bacterium]
MARELDALATRAYPLARRDAAKETGLPLATFPEACPWPVAQVLGALSSARSIHHHQPPLVVWVGLNAP